MEDPTMSQQPRISAARRRNARARVIAATASQDVALPALTGLMLLGLAYCLMTLLG